MHELSGSHMDPRALRILHVDMDAFYASVEQRDRPELRGKPVIVGGPPEKRGVVCAASYEVRAYGVRSAMPSARAMRLCPHAIFLPPDFARYTAASRAVMAILRSYTPLVEPLSLDEAFLDVAGSRRLFGAAEVIAGAIKCRIREELALVASVGVARTKFLAKIASDHRKPDGLCIVAAEDELGFLHPLPVERLFGIGPKSAERLRAIGYATIGALASAPREHLQRVLGSFAAQAQELAWARDPRPVVAERRELSHGKERTFERDLVAPEELERRLLYLSREVGFELLEKGLVGRTVVLKVRFADFRTITRSHTLDRATAAGDAIWTTVRELWTEVPRQPVRLLGVTMKNLSDELEAPAQAELFAVQDEEARAARERLQRAELEIRRRFGADALRPLRFVPPPRPAEDDRAAPEG
ncbi:MAG: DNA polymerase IV [Planctomycetes bacterium]|nr:DNA polymerase IV [Planctomycetota bacterium]